MSLKSFLCIDPGRSCGWAVADAGKPVVWGRWDLRNKPNESSGMAWLRLRTYLQEMLAGRPRDVLVVYEDVRAHKGTAAAHTYGAIASIIQAEVETLRDEGGVHLEAVGVGTWKRSLTGKGNAGKPRYIEEAEKRWKVEGLKEDEAAALGMLHWALEKYCRPTEKAR